MEAQKGTTMKNALIRVSSLILAVALVATPAAGLAQTQTPTREGNIWNWRDHQPTETQVRQEEKAAGVALAPSPEASDEAALRQIYRQLVP
jgi:hypothetical protein